MNNLQEQAAHALHQLEEAIVATLDQYPEGLTNTQIAKMLGIETGDPGEHRNMLSWSIISRLIRSGKIERVKANRSVLLRAIRS